jgi:D-beta-D-heptose 7-phosphate kinase/D-beta-D-heptose 1-phosphate adenosyltransferase
MTSHLTSLTPKLVGHWVLCVGDVMLDRYIYGQVERISPEAPIPVLRIQRESETLGGAGNVVRNLVSLGGYVDVIGIVGDDDAGKSVSNQFAALSRVQTHLLTDRNRPTTLKVRYVADGQQMLRADQEVTQAISADLEQQILHHVRAALVNCKVVILSDYAKGVLTAKLVEEIINLAHTKGCKVLIDPKGRDFGRYRGAFMLTPNRKELTEVTGVPIRSFEDTEKAALKLIETHHVEGILAKMGGDGVCLVMKGQPAVHFQASPHEVFDVSGAGDTVVATLALAIAGGLSAKDSAELANIAGAIVVGKVGTAAVTREELERALLDDETRQSAEKIVSLAHAAADADRWHKQGLKVGFTNGCFDLLHPGHISLIRQARTVCNKLIVGINSDASIKRLKGEPRPIQNESARSSVLASLADVDKVIIFEDDTPLAAIEAIRPTVLVKGADYSLEQVVGRELVETWGGTVVLAKLIDGQSTTATIAKLQTPKKAG